LGYVAVKNNDANAAIEWLKKAVQIASPYYKGFYTAQMGDLYAVIGKKEEAVQAYNDAISIAEQNADVASLKDYQAKLDALK
jgi:Tfp pilus assembly protein PilF